MKIITLPILIIVSVDCFGQQIDKTPNPEPKPQSIDLSIEVGDQEDYQTASFLLFYAGSIMSMLTYLPNQDKNGLQAYHVFTAGTLLGLTRTIVLDRRQDSTRRNNKVLP